MTQRGVLALQGGELVVEGGDECACRGEIVDREVGGARVIHYSLLGSARVIRLHRSPSVAPQATRSYVLASHWRAIGP